MFNSLTSAAGGAAVGAAVGATVGAAVGASVGGGGASVGFGPQAATSETMTTNVRNQTILFDIFLFLLTFLL